MPEHRQSVATASSLESLARELYGLEQAFANVWEEADWKAPKGAENWVSKCQCGLRDRFSVKALLSQGVKCPAAQEEVRRTMESEALFQMYLSRTSSAPGSSDE